MGFTPFEGVMMGTRAGSIDPGILLHLAGDGVTPEQLREGLARRSGLVAVGGTPDVRELTRRADTDDDHAAAALAMFARRAAAGIAAVATSLDHLDALVFTGGIGARAVEIRTAVVDRLQLLGFPVGLANGSPDSVLHTGPPAVVCVVAREDAVIADEVAALLRPSA
jgi:acetate kinase